MRLLHRSHAKKGSVQQQQAPAKNGIVANNDASPPLSFFCQCYVPCRRRLDCLALVILGYTIGTSVLVLTLDHAGVFRHIQPAVERLRQRSNHSPGSSRKFIPPPKTNYLTPNEKRGSAMNGNEKSPPMVYQFNQKTQSDNATAKVAYVVTITGCDTHDGQVDQFMSVDGAAVLAYSIHQNSVHGRGRYDYDLYAFHHPNASSCAKPLEQLGYIVQERDTPVKIAEIRNEQLQQHIQKWGCCGEKELIKFEAFTLMQYPIVVLLDLDTLILKPLDRLFDFLLDTEQLPEPDDLLYVNKPAAFGRNANVTIPHHLDMLFTIDYATVDADMDIKPVQGGFNIFRPNITVRNEILDIVRKGDYRLSNNTGWGGRTGPLFWGDTTFQGLVPYYFQILHPGRALELNYCIWNDNNYPPYKTPKGYPDSKGMCTTLQENCEDCRLRPLEGTGSVHFTACYKPWLCHFHSGNDPIHNAKCHVLLKKWFETRSAMEQSWGRSGRGRGKYETDLFLGYCHDWGLPGYQALEGPFGAPQMHS